MEIRLHNLRFRARHGCLPQERVVGGDYSVSLLLEVNVDDAATAHDDLRGTVDYAAVYEVVKREMEKPSNLLEHVAARIGKGILRDFSRVASVEVTVKKCAPPIPGIDCDGISVTLRDYRER
ncbi:MAG: dihydroneopterin aldolase [Alloprevotella sp.]|nr:dihydroneopterin aldolase [Alloprevotella sp.]